MSSARNLCSKHKFLCSICIDDFTDPVSTPCGHNFCKRCIAQYWNTKAPCDCPLCQTVFVVRPDLKVNTLLSDAFALFNRKAEHEAGGGSEGGGSRDNGGGSNSGDSSNGGSRNNGGGSSNDVGRNNDGGSGSNGGGSSSNGGDNSNDGSRNNGGGSRSNGGGMNNGGTSSNGGDSSNDVGMNNGGDSSNGGSGNNGGTSSNGGDSSNGGSGNNGGDSSNDVGGNLEQQAAQPEVPGDFCTGTEVKATDCQTQQEPHLTVSPLKKPRQMETVENREDGMCPKHHKPLELFCESDQTCVCMMCTVLEHKTHEVVLLSEGYEGKKAELRKTKKEMSLMVQKRRVEIKMIKDCLKTSKAAADRIKVEGIELITVLMECLARVLKELKERMEEEKKAREKEAGELIKDLKKEIGELTKRSAAVEQLLLYEDHLLFLQDFSLEAAPPTKDWTAAIFCPSTYEETLVRALLQLEETLSKEKKKLLAAELKRK